MSLRRTRAIARKEFLHILRDARSLIAAIAQPVLMLLLFGYALSLDVDRIPTVIYDLDRTPLSGALIKDFRGSRYFEVMGEVRGYAPIERDMESRRALLGVVIPADYSKNLAAGRTAQVQLLLDGSDSNTASIAKGYAEGLIQTYADQQRRQAQIQRTGSALAAPVEAQVRVWYNTNLVSRDYIVPGLIAVILMIIAGMLTSLTIAREWENGTMEQLLSTPVRPMEMALGKLSLLRLGLGGYGDRFDCGSGRLSRPHERQLAATAYRQRGVSVRSAGLGTFHLRRQPHPIGGLSTQHPDVLFARVFAVRVHLFAQQYAVRDSIFRFIRAGQVFHQYGERNLPKRSRAGVVVV